jgi:diketogulonate reductase-like aldo/keto reductase
MPAGAAAPLNSSRTLADGAEMPWLGLGVWQVAHGDETENSVRWALELGYRHIDTAQAYGNEESVGRALRDSGVPREEIFLTTKFYPAHDDPEAEAEQSLRRLGVEYVGGPAWAWPGMERARELGYARSIGVSNFSATELAEVMGIASSPPVVNQVQFSPFEYRGGLLQACSEHNVALEAYSPLGTGRHLGGRAVVEISERVGHTPAQVLLRWCIQRDAIVIPKSTHRERIEENAQIFDFELSDADLSALDGLDHTGGTSEAREQKWW